MAIVQIRSENPQFSFLIKKNPRSGLSLRSIRKGIAYGWYADESTYNVYFKDGDNEISYKQFEEERFEYLNVSRYQTPLFPLNAISEFFSAPLKSRDDKDAEGFEHSFWINMIHIEVPHYLDFFEKHVKGFTFETRHLAHKSYTLRVTTRRSLHELLHVVNVLCLFLAMFGKEHLDLSESALDKYVKSILAIEAPFYIRSLFARNFLTSRERYQTYKQELEKSSAYEIRLAFGSTAQQRRSYISRVLPFDKAILDIGCGEGFYAIPFAAKLEHCYYAIDVREEMIETVLRKAARKEMDNIIPFLSIEHFLADYNGESVDVILTEVIEHMSKEEAKQLILQVCERIDFDHFIITTPNADFNVFYEISGYRHEDHKWEMGQSEFQAWFRSIAQEAGTPFAFISIGDEVNGIPTTQGVILRKKEGLS